jgi:hypothetical protein
VLRLLLWLVPEHVPQHPQLHQGPGSPVVSAAARAQAACHASAEGQDSPTLSGNVDWRYSLGLAYAKDFVKVSSGVLKPDSDVQGFIVGTVLSSLAHPLLATCV